MKRFLLAIVTKLLKAKYTWAGPLLKTSPCKNIVFEWFCSVGCSLDLKSSNWKIWRRWRLDESFFLFQSKILALNEYADEGWVGQEGSSSLSIESFERRNLCGFSLSLRKNDKRRDLKAKEVICTIISMLQVLSVDIELDSGLLTNKRRWDRHKTVCKGVDDYM